MKEFKSEEIIYVQGKGNVFIVYIPNPDRLSYNPLIPVKEETVIIDETYYTVAGIETTMKLVDPPFMGEKVGIIVKGLK